MPFISKVPYFGGVFFFFLFYRTPAFPQNNCWCNYQGTGMFSSDHMLCTLWSSWLVCQLSGRSSAFKFSFHCFSSFLSLSLCAFPRHLFHLEIHTLVFHCLIGVAPLLCLSGSLLLYLREARITVASHFTSSKRFPLCGSKKFTMSYPYSRQFILWFCMFKKNRPCLSFHCRIIIKWNM